MGHEDPERYKPGGQQLYLGSGPSIKGPTSTLRIVRNKVREPKEEADDKELAPAENQQQQRSIENNECPFCLIRQGKGLENQEQERSLREIALAAATWQALLTYPTLLVMHGVATWIIQTNSVNHGQSVPAVASIIRMSYCWIDNQICIFCEQKLSRRPRETCTWYDSPTLRCNAFT